MMDWNVILGTASLLQTLALFYVGAKASKIDRLESQLEARTTELVEAKLAGKTGELFALLQATKTELESVRRELANGRDRFNQGDARARQIEVDTLREISKVREQMATRDDLTKLWEAIQERRSAHVGTN
jgi:hypothetical protein